MNTCILYVYEILTRIHKNIHKCKFIHHRTNNVWKYTQKQPTQYTHKTIEFVLSKILQRFIGTQI